MSIRDVVVLQRAQLQDADTGLAATMAELAAAAGVTGLALDPSDFEFFSWSLPERTLKPTTKHNVTVRPQSWSPMIKQANLRDGTAITRVDVEFFTTDNTVLENLVLFASVALAMLADDLPTYSQAHQGTIIDVLDPSPISYGRFEGALSSGLSLTTTLEERDHDA